MIQARCVAISPPVTAATALQIDVSSARLTNTRTVYSRPPCNSGGMGYVTVIHNPDRAAKIALATTMRPETLCHLGLRWRSHRENCKAPNMQNRLALRMCTNAITGAATNRAFSVLISGSSARPANRAIPAAVGMALRSNSVSGTFQSIRAACVIEGV